MNTLNVFSEIYMIKSIEFSTFYFQNKLMYTYIHIYLSCLKLKLEYRTYTFNYTRLFFFIILHSYVRYFKNSKTNVLWTIIEYFAMWHRSTACRSFRYTYLYVWVYNIIIMSIYRVIRTILTSGFINYDKCYLFHLDNYFLRRTTDIQIERAPSCI